MRALAPVLAALLLVMSAFPALAAKPDKQHFDDAFSEEYPADVICDFAVRLDFVDQGHAITFQPAADGSQRQILGGRLSVTVTNLDADVSVHLNIAGPGRFTYAGERLSIAGGGPWLLYLFPGDDEGPGMYYTRGHVALQIDLTTGQILSAELPANSIDLCQALGGAAASGT